MPMYPPHILLIAEACNPEWESVPLVGFNLYKAIARHTRVTLVTQIRNRDALLRHVEETEAIRFIDSERLARPFHCLGRFLTLGRPLGWTTRQAVNLIPYLYFEHLVYKLFRTAIARRQFDIIHRVTPLTPTYPSPIVSWTSIPFVLGPINGGLPWPKGTRKVRWAEMEWLSYLRGAYRLLPSVRQTYRRAACVIAASRYTFSALPCQVKRTAVYIPENGIDPNRFCATGRVPPSAVSPFRILFAGRLVPYKGADIVLEAVASSPTLHRETEVVIAGEGPQSEKLMTAARALAVRGRVNFTGRVSQTELAHLFRTSSVFAFPSLREFGGAVVIEAMACGLPCIVLDHGGPSEHVTAATGIRIPVGSRSTIVAALRQSLEQLAERRSSLDAMSHAGVQRIAKLYTWDAKARQILDVYTRVLTRRANALTLEHHHTARSV